MNDIVRTTAAPPSPYVAQPRPESEVAAAGSGFDLSALMRMVRDWWLLIAACAAAGVVFGLLTFFFATPLYRASVTLEVNPPTVEVSTGDKRNFDATSSSSYDMIATQVGLLQSHALAQRVAQNLKLGADPTYGGGAGSLAARTDQAANVVSSGLSVETPELGQLVTLQYVSRSAEDAARVANGIADAFIETGIERRFDASNYARTFLQQQIGKTRAALEKSERELVAYQQKQGLINTSTQEGGSADVASLQGASLVSLNEALATATGARVQAQANYEQARIAAQADATTSSSALRGVLAGLQAEYQEKRTTLKPDHPEMVSLQSRIDELQRQIGREQSVAASGKVASLLAAYRAAVATENRLRGQVAGLKGSVLDLRGRSIQYNILQRDVDTNRSLYDALLQRYKEVGVGSGVGASPISIVDRAQAPGGPFKPNLFFDLLAGLLGGLLAGAVLAFILDHLNDTIRTREDVRVKLGRSCLGVIPKERDSTSLLEDFRDPASTLSEAYSAVLAALRFSGEGGAPKSVVLTSANPSEGKSSSALALAANYARRGERVLLIDADLRRPVFKGLSNKTGLTNLLTGSDDLARHISQTEIENLWLLPCGPIAPNPADLLSNSRMAEVVADAASKFDRVVVDGPPVMGLADSSFLAAAVQSVVMIIESGRTRTRAAREAIERIELTGAKLLGVVLTKSTEEASRYGYGSYRYYRAVEGDERSTIMIAQSDEA